jgi:hypothetical protein
MDMSFTTLERARHRLVLVLHTAENPSLLEWAEYEAELRRLKHLGGGDSASILNLVVSDGGAPNTTQRSAFQNDIFGGKAAQVALLTNSLSNPVKRGIAKAITWLNPGFRIFEPDDLPGALDYLESSEAFDDVWRGYCALQARMPPVETLAVIARQLGRSVLPSARVATAT